MFNFEKAIQEYNEVMYICGLDFLTIGTDDTEDKENKKKWNIRDLVAECAYQLEMYDTEGTMQYEELHDYSDGGFMNPHSTFSVALTCKGRLWRFVNKYKRYIEGIKAHETHCSDYYG